MTRARGTARKLAADWLPPKLSRSLQRWFGGIRFHGDYPSWADAQADSRGYGSEAILARVLEASLAVKSGRAAFERDSVLFHAPEYPWELLAFILRIAAANRGSLSVLDFGGSLGSTYFQCRGFLAKLDRLAWSIVEQPHFVAAGEEHIADSVLRFHPDIESSMEWRKPDVILFGSVLQYLEDPHGMLKRAAGYGIPHILIDRTPFIEAESDRLTVQIVSPRIYAASYPAWFLSRTKLLSTLSPEYRLLEEYPCKDRANIPSEYKGMLFARRPL